MKETENEISSDEVELTLRRFAMTKNDQQLTKLLNNMFPKGISTEETETEEGEE